MMTRIEAIAASIAVATVRSLLARRTDGIVTDAIQLAVAMRRHFLAAAKHHKLDDAEKHSVFDKLGWAMDRIKHEADKIERAGK
jgi:hypothetical protein